MSQYWTIASAATGEVLHCICTDGPDQHPRDCGQIAWAEDLLATAIAGPPDPASEIWDGEAWVADLGAIKARMRDAVCARAEAVRNQFITPGSGQAITYTRKEAEARAWSSGDDPETAPFLAAEAASTGMPIDELAALVIVQADAWVAVGSAIEARRRGLLVAIEEATTRAALDALDIEAGWPGE